MLNEQLPDVALEIHADLLTPAQVDGLVSARWTSVSCAHPWRART